MGAGVVPPDDWGTKAAQWAEHQEPSWAPIYASLFERAGLSSGARVLDVGCGAGGALLVARGLGAHVSGVDVAQGMIDVASSRLPGAPIKLGDMSALPFEDQSFDLVTGFNSFQFAADATAALHEARRVCKNGGTVATLLWGPKENCDLILALGPIFTEFLPAPPEGPDFSAPGVMKATMSAAGLTPTRSGVLEIELAYPDKAAAWRAISSSLPLVRAIRRAGEPAVHEQLDRSLERFTQPDGRVVLKNQLRWTFAER